MCLLGEFRSTDVDKCERTAIFFILIVPHLLLNFESNNKRSPWHQINTRHQGSEVCLQLPASRTRFVLQFGGITDDGQNNQRTSDPQTLLLTSVTNISQRTDIYDL